MDIYKEELNSYRNADNKKYVFFAVLDKETCKICGKLDGRIFKVSDAKTGVNYPPMHDKCRCTTIAYFKDIYSGTAQRRARNPITNKSYLVPKSMTYSKWIKGFGDVAKPNNQKHL